VSIDLPQEIRDNLRPLSNKTKLKMSRKKIYPFTKENKKKFFGIKGYMETIWKHKKGISKAINPVALEPLSYD